ncbi:hypothetical protein D0Z08_19485 [Nocardioides immobilis]|uniref:Uncharacterized protein n=1 Tax=Nocardioides immobilis TaxID=2049295 RepID=A0A417XYH6_9ACTN|nr:hypothetical protein [Nocardioides immobilis]RHW25412.1 hypothetical protein D0Z08_19485 [Nocardioides immobilis]
MDVLLIDDKDGEEALLAREWADADVRVLHSDDLTDLEVMMAGGQPEGWPDGPYDVAAAVVDLDLGNRGPGPAGGIVATHRISAWLRDVRRSAPIILRTADVDDDRSLAAVLAAEVAEGPLPLWGKTSADAASLLSFIRASVEGTVEPGRCGASIVHPVRFIREERGDQLLGNFLYDGPRSDVWERLRDGFDPETAVLSTGVKKHNKFWDHQKGLIAAILYLRDQGSPLHTIGGKVVRIRDIERDIDLAVLHSINVAIYAVEKLPDSAEAARRDALRLLEANRAAYQEWLEGEGTRRPYQNRNNDQGDFWGTFGRVLGHPEVVELFRH